ncbi:seizure 6-like protein [Brachyhypopomus gauderio]|uniref:seizure 6-like protein n=1 Tax=Brachyhypopomus gauderio TaxID=698409 RepID=UPI0040434115
MHTTRSVESRALYAVLWMGILWRGILTQDGAGPTPPPYSPPAVHGPAPSEGMSEGASVGQDLLDSVLAHKDHLLAQKGVELATALPADILPVLGKSQGPGSPARPLSPEHQRLLKKMLTAHSGAPHSTQAQAGLTEAFDATTMHSTNRSTMSPQEAGGGELPSGTVITTATAMEPTPGTFPSAVSRCMVSFLDPEGYIDSTADQPLPAGAFLRCTYTVNVYTGYGVELQVKSVNLSEGEELSIRGVDEDGDLLMLANHTLLVEGQVIRSPTNTISVFYRSSPEGGVGVFQLHYQLYRLSCALPRRPHFGEVSVLDLRPGGTAHFSCHMGYHLQGASMLTCLNASLPVWSQQEPSCRALCGGIVKNATVGRVLSPSPHPGPNSTLDRSCSWSLEAPSRQRLHLHLERMVLGLTDRLVLWSGLDAGSVVLFDSARGGPIPFEGVISEGPAVRIQFITDQLNNHNTGFNIRYEAFEKGHCYEPYIQNGNFSTSDASYSVGTIVQFTCDAGHSLEQGPPVIECINTRDPYWNDTEPLCKALCGGDLSGPGGVILSPNWPEWYGEGEDCTWRIRVGEDKRVLLDVQLLNLSDSDMLTILDGDEVTTRILGQYVGGTSPFKLSSTTPDLTITFHSDPAGLVFGKGEGFIINYMEVSRNDSCPDLPEIQNGWKTTSHTALVRGSRITYQCDPGYDLVGRETLTCQLDLTWSNQPPFCEKIMYCTDPGHVEHSVRTLSDPKLLVGTTIQYSCNPGYILQGGATLTCYGREPGTPVWTSRLPHCVSEEAVSCENPGLPHNGYQILSKRLYLPGESLSFMCYEGYELIGEIAIKCILGNPSFWSGQLPLCRANHECSGNHALEVAEATAETSLDGGSTTLAIFILALLLSVLLGGAYIYVTRCRYHPNLRLPLMYPHPYSQITVETEFDNPLYETGGDTREYEVSI